jgi:hypothetical protein
LGSFWVAIFPESSSSLVHDLSHFLPLILLQFWDLDLSGDVIQRNPTRVSFE